MAARRRWRLALVTVCLVAAGLRLWGLAWELPYLHHPDEPINLDTVQTMWREGSLNPHNFTYGGTFFYSQAAALAPYVAVASATGSLDGPGDLASPRMIATGSGVTDHPGAVLAGRGLSVAFGVGVVVLAMYTAREVFGREAAGVAAGVLAAVSPAAVANSRLVTPDMTATFFAMVAVWAALVVLRRGPGRTSLWAGAAVGAALAAKYPLGLAALPVAAAHLARSGGDLWRRAGHLARAGLVAAATAVAVTPFALVERGRFLSQLAFQRAHYASGHHGMEGDTLTYYGSVLWSTEGVVAVLALGPVLALPWLPAGVRGRVGVVAAFVVPYLTFIATQTVRNERTLLPALPVLAVLAAGALVWLAVAAWRRLPPAAALPASLLSVVLVLAVPVSTAVAESRAHAADDSHATARAWIAETLPPGSRIAVEAYVPYVAPGHYDVVDLDVLITKPPGWFATAGIDYVVASEGMYGRFFRNRQRYPTQAASYERLFAAYPEVARFDDGGYEIRVLEVTEGR